MEKQITSHGSMVKGEHSRQELAKFILVIASIAVMSWLLNSIYGQASFIEFLRWYMGVFFVVFASFKLIGYKMFAMMFAEYDVVAKKVMAYAYAYPFIELGLGVMYVANILPNARDWVAVVVMGVGSVGVLQEIKRRSGIHCACLGNVIKLPLSTVSLVEDVGMGLMALALILFS